MFASSIEVSVRAGGVPKAPTASERTSSSTNAPARAEALAATRWAARRSACASTRPAARRGRSAGRRAAAPRAGRGARTAGGRRRSARAAAARAAAAVERPRRRERARHELGRGEHARLETQIGVGDARDHDQRAHARELALAVHLRGERAAARERGLGDRGSDDSCASKNTSRSVRCELRRTRGCARARARAPDPRPTRSPRARRARRSASRSSRARPARPARSPITLARPGWNASSRAGSPPGAGARRCSPRARRAPSLPGRPRADGDQRLQILPRARAVEGGTRRPRVRGAGSAMHAATRAARALTSSSSGPWLRCMRAISRDSGPREQLARRRRVYFDSHWTSRTSAARVAASTSCATPRPRTSARTARSRATRARCRSPRAAGARRRRWASCSARCTSTARCARASRARWRRPSSCCTTSGCRSSACPSSRRCAAGATARRPFQPRDVAYSVWDAAQTRRALPRRRELRRAPRARDGRGRAPGRAAELDAAAAGRARRREPGDPRLGARAPRSRARRAWSRTRPA